MLAGGEDGKVSTCVTRSIGDWDGSRAMIPQPELRRFEVSGEEHVRVVLCSDGVWDFVTVEEAAAVARRARTCDDATRLIVQKAYNRSMRKLERLKDDTTCVVVDLNPSGRPFGKPDLGGGGAGDGGCCALM